LFLFACAPKLYLNVDCQGVNENKTVKEFSKKYPLNSAIEVALDFQAMKISNFSSEKVFVDLYKRDMEYCVIKVMQEE